jgi:hypothetical protein
MFWKQKRAQPGKECEMAGKWKPTSVVLIILLFATPAGATTVRPKQVVCPVCDEKIVVLAIGLTTSSAPPPPRPAAAG